MLKIWQKYFTNKSLLITVVTVLVPLTMQAIYIKYVSYYVDKEDYGNFVLLQTLISGMSLVFLQVPSQAYDRYFNTAENKEEFINLFRSLLIIVNVISIPVVIIYAEVFERVTLLVMVLTYLYFAFQNTYSINQKIYLLDLQRKKYFYLKSLEGGAKFILPIVLYAVFGTLASFLFGIVLGYILSSIVLYAFTKTYKFYFYLNLGRLKKYIKYAYPILFVSLFSWGISFSDRYFIEYFSNTESLAIYAILAQVAGFGQVVGQVYAMYVNPILLKSYENSKNQTFASFTRYLIILFGVFVLLFSVFMFLPRELFTFQIQNEVIVNGYYYHVFTVLVLAIFFAVMQLAMIMYFQLIKRLGVVAAIYSVAFIMNIAGCFLVKDFGIIAAAYSTLVAYGVIVLLESYYIVKTRNIYYA